MYHHKNLNHFTKDTEKKPLALAVPPSHNTYFVKKIKNSHVKSHWILKDLVRDLPAMPVKKYHAEYYKTKAIEETIAQEFFRLLYAPSPKTRWIKEQVKGIDFYFILSKEVEGFDISFLSKPNRYNDIYNAIENGSIRGLATVLLIALLLREADLNQGNLGIDSRGNVVKIDGGLCFAHLKSTLYPLLHEKNLEFTLEDIAALPALHSYQPFNWVDLIGWSEKIKNTENYATSILLDLSKNPPPAFKQELYKTITLICLLPSDLIYSFTAAYSPDSKKANNFAIEIIKQIKKLACMAAQMPDFLNYRASLKAEQDIIDYTRYLKTFNTMGKSNLLDEIKNTCHIDVLDIIFTRSIKGYRPIKNLCSELNVSPSNPNTHVFIEALKNKIAVYLTCPSHLNRRMIYKMLCETKDKILNLNSAKRSLTTFCINSVSHHLEHLEKITAAPSKRSHAMAEDTPPTGAKKRKTMTFFNSIYTANDSEENLSVLKKAFNL